jgi:hypothetical protein
MKITKEELQELYQENENKIVCDKLNITNATLISYIKKLGIKQKGKGNRKPKSLIQIKND